MKGWWARNGYKFRLAGNDLFWASVAIVSGLLGILLLKWVYDAQLKSVLAFSFTLSDSDWNTVMTIWLAEVPLAFLLRRLLGAARVENVEAKQRQFENLMKALEARGVREYRHLRAFRASPIRRIKGKVIQVIVNIHSSKAYWMDTRVATIAEQGVIDLEAIEAESLEELRTRLNALFGNHLEFLFEQDAQVRDLLNGEAPPEHDAQLSA